MGKKKWIVWIVVMALLFTAVPVSAETGENGLKTEEAALTEENRYDSVYFQEPEERYPQYSAKGRQAGLSFEEYMVDELKKLPDSINVSAYKIPVGDAGTPFFQVLNNHPELFYVNSSVRYSYSGGYIVSYSVSYRFPKEEIPQYREELEAEVDLAAAQVDASLSDVEKALAVHDYLALHCEYDLDRLNSGTLPAVSHSAYGALVNRMAVCDGYAGAFAYIMKDRFGIPCITVSSSEMVHAWNMIYIGSQWYHVDVTWDDPTRDLIGRATHSYFLLSDSVISDSSHEHSGWVSDYKATSTAYNSAFWTDITSAIIHNQGAWYYSKYDGNTRKVNLVKKSGLLSGSETAVYAGDLWGTSSSYYSTSFMYLDKANGNIYFSTKNDLRRLNQDGTNEVVYSPSVPANHCIYGFTVRDSQLCYAVQNSPNLPAKQNVQAYTLPELEQPVVPEITGISADDVHAVYDGSAKRITVTGTQAGDVVRYALEGESSYSASQPSMVNAGTYQVSYRVERAGWLPFTGKAVVSIEQAVPAYTAPAGLKGSSGETLASVALPEGFSWQTPASTQLSQEGNYTYLVKYVPSDTRNYKEVSDIQVEVAVSCPGHEYTVTVTKEPTSAEKGERLYTCRICGSTYTEEIDPLNPSLPGLEGIHAEDIQKTYDGTAAEIVLKGILEGDKVLFAGEGGVFGGMQPTIINAGTYQVSYRVEREGYQPFIGNVSIVIEKAEPAYTVPSGLHGNCGESLEAIGLPEGFLWENANMRFSKEGTFTCAVKYVPNDANNYKEVSGIQVQVTVTCPGHQYELIIKREPTTVQKGFQTYACKICGDAYTEEIPMLIPQRPGNVSGQKVSKATVNSLKFTWKKAAGIRYELVLSQGSKKVSAKTAATNSVAFTKLKSGTAYTLKITPYRLVDGQKVYAAKSASVKAATAPSQVKLSSVKKSGSRKAKVTWKKVAGASGYEVYMRTGTGKYKRVKTLTSATKVSYTKSGLKKGNKYGFRVRAYKNVGSTKVYGSYSGTKSVKIL